MPQLNILIVDDSPIYRRIMTAAINKSMHPTEISTAASAKEALDQIRRHPFDFILLDLNMPVMSGFDTMAEIHAIRPKQPVIIVSSMKKLNDIGDPGEHAVKLGAIGFIEKPLSENVDHNVRYISEKFGEIINGYYYDAKFKTVKTGKHKGVSIKPLAKSFDMILFASSVGGPDALTRVMPLLETHINKPVLLVQHIPCEFTAQLAVKLDGISKLTVKVAEENDVLNRNTVYIAPGGKHMLLEKKNGILSVKLSESDYVCGVRPSADVLFKSIARNYAGSTLLVVIMTGMGVDGTKGLIELKQQCNCYCIAQSEATCLVYGMSRSVVQAELSDEITDLDDIAERINKMF